MSSGNILIKTKRIHRFLAQESRKIFCATYFPRAGSVRDAFVGASTDHGQNICLQPNAVLVLSGLCALLIRAPHAADQVCADRTEAHGSFLLLADVSPAPLAHSLARTLAPPQIQCSETVSIHWDLSNTTSVSLPRPSLCSAALGF